MKDGFIRVGVATPTTTVANPIANVEAHLEAARIAAEDGTRVLVFPELSLTTYGVSDLLFRPRLIADSEEAVRAYAEATRTLDMISFVGAPVRVDGKLYNCAVAIGGGEILGIVPKTYLPTYGGLYETRYFAPAPREVSVIDYAGEKTVFGTKLLFRCSEMPSLVISAEICEDLFTAASPSLSHAAAGATVIVNLAASDEAVGKAAYRRDLVKTHSARTMTAYLFANAGIGESGNDAVFSGHSMIASLGKLTAENKPFSKETYFAAEIDTERLLFERSRTNTFVPNTTDYVDVPFSLSEMETPLRTPVSKTPFIPADAQELSARCETILNIQAQALATRMTRSYSKTLVLGVSGGLDSTLAVLVAARAVNLIGVGRENIISVTMPCFGTTKRTRSNAEMLAEKLGTTLRVVDIKEAVEVHFRDIGHDPADHSVVYENAQARERTQVLMDIANGMSGLVVGTGDLSELALGWATYNGDHMSMYGVNGGIPKTMIRHVVRHEADLFRASGNTAVANVLYDILDTPVSPELLPPNGEEIAQCTEGIVGPYELHDFFLYHFVRSGLEPAKILRLAVHAFSGEYTEDIIRGWLTVFVRRFFSQQFKRTCLPDGPKVGSVALSPRGDWRMPSDASNAAWMKELK